MQSPAPHARFARRERFFRPSPVRSVWDVSMEPGMISLAGGNPDLTQLPLDALGEAAAHLIKAQGLEVLQYGAGSGIAPLREQLALLMRTTGLAPDPDEILITAGSQFGIELVTAMLCDPGNVMLAEAPTYVGAISTFLGLEVAVEHVACDEHGLIPNELKRRIIELRAAGRTVKALYTIPNFSNPAGVTLSAARRPVIAQICKDAGVTVIEDDPYGLVRFAGAHIAPIKAHDDDVIYLGSMSKIFSPGIRIGWVYAPRALRDRLLLLSEATLIHPSLISQHLALAYLRDFDWRATLDKTIALYRERAEALLAGLAEALPAGSTWTSPSGGFFVWATLPEGYSADALFTLAVEEGVVFIAGPGFFADGTGDRHLRLSFSLEAPDQIAAGLERLARATARLTRAC
ncbi:aminotransferase-like domain-containing protein [Leucobacter sp. HY1910]